MARMPDRNAVARNAVPWTPAASDSKRRVPRPPDWLDDGQRRRWRALWRSAVGSAWLPVEDFDVVERLFLLRSQVADDPKLHAPLTALERDLGLNPKARRALALAVGDAPASAAPVSLVKRKPRTDPRLQAVGE